MVVLKHKSDFQRFFCLKVELFRGPAIPQLKHKVRCRAFFKVKLHAKEIVGCRTKYHRYFAQKYFQTVFSFLLTLVKAAPPFLGWMIYIESTLENEELAKLGIRNIAVSSP